MLSPSGMSSAADPPLSNPLKAFVERLRELGYSEGKNVSIEMRFAEYRIERLPALAADLVRAKVDVIVAGGTASVLAAQAATKSVPIVMADVADPVGTGLVQSLARPGGNVTGAANLLGATTPKQLELLREVVPGLSDVAVLRNPTNAATAFMYGNLEAAANRIGVRLHPVDAQTTAEIARAMGVGAQRRAKGMIVLTDHFFYQERMRIVELAAAAKLPAAYSHQEFAKAGGLMAYAYSVRDVYLLAATYVDRILKGAKPSALPVEQPSKFYLVVNMKTAKALGITVPQSVLVRADEVIR